MAYRSITQDEIPIVADIQARAFRQDVDQTIDVYRRGGRVDWQNARLLTNERDQPVAALNVFERAMSLNGGELTAGLVGSVAVPPDQRRRGYARGLITGLLLELHDNEIPISALFPFSAAYYRRLAYPLVNLNWYLDVPPRQLPDYPERVAVRRATVDDHTAIRACYECARRQPQHNGWLERTDWEWQNRVWREGIEAVICPADGEVEGYLLYTLAWTVEGHDQPVKIVEWVATSDAAWRGLVGFLASLGDQASVVEYNAPRNSPLLLALNEPYSAVGGSAEYVFHQAARLVSGFTVRIVHLPAALGARTYPPDLNVELLLRVKDSQLPANSQPLHVHITDGTASVAPAYSLFPDHTPINVETDIATFSQLFVGFMSAEQARILGRLHADDATCARLSTAFSAAPLYMHSSDWF
jgi:predicted acetyltransferase